MVNSIKERNKIINEYITNLDQKLVKNNDNIEPIEIDNEDEEEDEFAKAEAKYKQSNKQDINKQELEQNEPTFKQLEQLYHSQIFKSKSNLKLKNNEKMLILKNPEMIYIRENNHMKKQQSLRKLRLKIYDVLPSIKSNDKTKDKDIKSFLVHNSNNNFHIPLTCSLSVSPKDKRNKSPKAFLIEKEKQALKCLNDPRNPYSKNWSNQLLKTRFNSKIKVKGFYCGIPQLKLEKLKEIQLPKVSYKLIII